MYHDVPEHSLNSYQLAIDLGTDYIEADLCLTKDGERSLTSFVLKLIVLYRTGIFIAMHDITLDATTDIANHPEFADRYRNGTVLWLDKLLVWSCHV